MATFAVRNWVPINYHCKKVNIVFSVQFLNENGKYVSPQKLSLLVKKILAMKYVGLQYVVVLETWQTCIFISNEPRHDKTNKMTCAPSKDLHQPMQPCSLIRVYVWCSLDSQEPMPCHVNSKDTDQTVQVPRLIRVLVAHTGHFVGFVVLQLKCYHSMLLVWAL